MEFSRLLKPGGKLLLSVPNRKSFIRIVQKQCNYVARLWGGKVFPYLEVSKNEFTPSEIRRSLFRVGISVDKCEIFDPVLPKFISKLGFGSLIIVSSHLANLDHPSGLTLHDNV